MNLRLYIIICIVAVLIILVGPTAADTSATIHGVVYGWDTFDPLDNAIVEVNSTPSQSMVAKYGLYSFELAPGNYTITASYYQNSTLTYQAKETITIEGEGNYVLDLLLLPVYSNELMENPDETPSSQETLTENSNKTTNENSKPEENASGSETFSSTFYLLGILLIFTLLIGGYKFPKNQKNKNKKFAQSKTGADKTKIPKTEVNHIEITNELKNPPSGKMPEPSTETEFQKNKSEVSEGKPEAKVSSISRPKPKTKIVRDNTDAGIVESRILESESYPEMAKTEQDSEIVKPDPEKKVQENPVSENSSSELATTFVVGPTVLKKPLPIPSDLQEIMDIIRGQGGRITQKELRSRLKYSEGKVSLMLADLERRELIEKFKRGRGNVVILRDDKR